MALARLSEIDVSTEGVMGAKDFFEAKVGVGLGVWVLLKVKRYSTSKILTSFGQDDDLIACPQSRNCIKVLTEIKNKYV